jgi:tetratricopeptide (TPR) repeat protein
LPTVKPAVEAYREAAAICPDQHLAWQGLATLYEKNPIKVYQEACIEVYKKLMEIFEKAGGDASVDKYFETGVKLGKLLCDRKNIVSAAEAFENLLEKAL